MISHIFVGSSNPVKVNAVAVAASETWPEIQVEGFAVPSQIGDQPMSDEETKKGAEHRAQNAFNAGKEKYPNTDSTQVLGVGLEGGVLTNEAGEMWSTVWVVVTDQTGQFFHANGARIRVPDLIAKRITTGEEMGPIVQALTGKADVRQKEGMFGIITKNFIDRTEEYAAIAKMALGIWYGRDWVASLSAENSV